MNGHFWALDGAFYPMMHTIWAQRLRQYKFDKYVRPWKRLNHRLANFLTPKLTQKRVLPQVPYFLKNGQINRVTKFSSTFRPTESDSVNRNRDLFISMQFQMQFPRLESRVVTIFFRIGFSGSGSTRKFGNPVDLTVF